MDRTRTVAVYGCLCVGFLALAGAIVAAIRTPPQGYEVSIYRATPPEYWLGIGVAVLVACTVLAFGDERSDTSRYAVVLGGAVLLSAVGLPLLRGYHFYGFNDSLTHLGWAKEMAAGTMTPDESLYPGSHTIAVIVAAVSGVGITHSMQLVVVLFALLYLLFVPLLVRLIYPDWQATVIAVVSALLFLPINHNGFKLLYFPFSFGAFLTPLVLYLLFRHMIRGEDGRLDGWLDGWLSPPGVLFVFCGVAMILVHPQAALNVILLCAAVAGFQHYRRRDPLDFRTRERPVAGIAAAVGVLFLLWTFNHAGFYRMFEQTLQSVSGTVLGSAETGQAISSRTDSISQVGSVAELFLKLFGIESLYVLLSGVCLFGHFRGWFDHLPAERRTVLSALLWGSVVLGPFFILHLFGRLSQANYFFRHVGFGLLLGTVLGSIVLRRAIEGVRYPSVRIRTLVRTVAVVVSVVLVAVSLATLYPSPFVYLPSNHVTEAQLQGYGTAFTYADDEVPFDGVRSTPERYQEALPATASPPLGRSVEPEAIRNGSWGTTGPRYLPISVVDVRREVDAYRSLRYSRSDLEAVARRPGVDRVVTNGQVDVYYTDGESDR